jgi:hypothetical protein
MQQCIQGIAQNHKALLLSWFKMIESYDIYLIAEAKKVR